MPSAALMDVDAERLDYIAALGATAIWISPIVANVDRTEGQDGYHGYWPTRAREVDERIGGAEARGVG